MNALLHFNWSAFDVLSGLKVAIGFVIMLVLMEVTGETWLATGLVVLFAWLTNVPGPLKDRVTGMVVFAIGAALFTLASGLMQLTLWPNVLAIAAIGFAGTLALAWGTRAFMVGYALISWVIYGPFLIESTSVLNCILAIVVGTGVLVLLNVAAAGIGRRDGEGPESGGSDTQLPMDYVLAYSATVAVVLAITTYLGWRHLKTDPTLAVGGAFYIFGFDAIKTWIAGIARVIGVVAGTIIGVMLWQIVGPGLILDGLIVGALFMCFAAMAVHPGAFMFFLLIFVAATWHGLEADVLDLTFRERLVGETTGVIAAMAGIALMQYLWQRMYRRT